MNDASLPFYPPRANSRKRRWVLGCWKGFWAKRRGWFGFLVAMIIPVAGYASTGRMRLVLLGLVLYFGAWLIGLAFLGSLLSFCGILAAVAVHGFGQAFYLRRQTWLSRRWLRSLFGFIVIGATIYCLYQPTIPKIDNYAIAIHTMKGTMVVRPGVDADAIRRGDLVVLSRSGTLAARDMAVVEIVGAAGDALRFGPEHYSVNGQEQDSRSGMRKHGEFKVAPGQFFIWHYALIGAESSAWDKVMLVPEGWVIGRVYDRWFWRKQSL